MPSQVAPLLRNEAAKALRRKLPFFGVFMVGLGCAISYFVAGRLNSASAANAWSYLAFSMQLLFSDICPIFIIVFSAMSLAEETGAGTIRAVLAAPVHRWELYLAKAVIGLFYTLALSVTALLLSIALATIHYHFGAVGDTFGVVYSRERTLHEFLLGYALSWIPLGALTMYGLFISTIIRSPGAAVATGTSTLYLIELTKHLVGLDPYIFTKYIGFSWVNLFQLAQGMDYQWQPEVWRMMVLSAAYAVVLFGAGLAIFVREDLNH
jgi:ABC-type transport system involved in multi-copper enzyme maturation permease subunit